MNLSTDPDLHIDKTHEYRVDGNVTAIYLMNQCTAPKPISPFVNLAPSVQSIADFTFDIEFASVTTRTDSHIMQRRHVGLSLT
jgi:hypothetical protein